MWEWPNADETPSSIRCEDFVGYVTCNRKAAMRPEYVLILAIIVVMVAVVFIALDRNDREH